MPLLCIALIALSACTHAAWNLICKSRHPSAAFFLISTSSSIIAMTPIFFYFFPMMAHIPGTVWILLLATGIVQALYYTSLGNAYRLSDISIAYPVARALPVLLVPIVTAFLHIGRSLSSVTVLAMLLVAVGCLIIPLPSFKELKRSTYINRGFLFILATAACTTSYTIIDSQALHFLHAAAVTPCRVQTALLYIALENAFIEVFLIPYVFLYRVERETFFHICRHSLRFPVISGITCTAGYTLVLGAMMLAANVSYVMAFRQLSIPLGALLGILILKEKLTMPKSVGLTAIIIGLIFVACC